jgi:hypothetical protein
VGDEAPKHRKENIADVCDWGEGGTTKATTSHNVKTNISGDLGTSDVCMCPGSWSTDWDSYCWTYAHPGLSHTLGWCCCRAHGMMLAAQVLGLGIYTHVYVNERPEPGEDRPNPSLDGQWCSTCNKHCWRGAWHGRWNHWEGACCSGGAGSTCYAPAGEYEGTYDDIRTDFGPWDWFWGDGQSDTCTHLAPP